MPGRHPRSQSDSLEKQLAPELNKPRIVHLRSYLAKIVCSEGSPWRPKLRVVEQVEELRPELEAYSVVGPELCSFEDGKVKEL